MITPILLNARNPGPMTGGGNNTYLLVGADRTAVLVDAGVGHPGHLDDMAAALAAGRARLAAVLVTHGHADHASGASAIASRHPGTAFVKYPWPAEDQAYPVPWARIDEGGCVGEGDEALKALRTPGHAPDHLAFWHEPSRTIFTGDLVTLGGSVVIQTRRGGNMSDYLASLQRLLALGARRLLPAHGPAIDDPASVLTAYLRHRQFREEQVVAALAAGHATVEAIAESIYDQLGPVLMAAARENVRAHLEKLRDEGRAIELDGRHTPR